MKNLFTALMTSFNAVNGSGDHNDFYNDVGGRLYKKGGVPQSAEYPYAVFSLVTGGKERTFTETYRGHLLQLDLYSKAQNHIANELEDMYAHQNALFDEKPLTITGSTLLWMRETNGPVDVGEFDDETLPDGSSGIRHWAVDYEVKTSLN